MPNTGLSVRLGAHTPPTSPVASPLSLAAPPVPLRTSAITAGPVWLLLRFSRWAVGPRTLRRATWLAALASVALVLNVLWRRAGAGAGSVGRDCWDTCEAQCTLPLPLSFNREPSEAYPPPYVRAPRSKPLYLPDDGRALPKLRILFLTHRFEYTSYMTRTFFFQYAAARRHPHVEAELWGDGLAGYDSRLTLRENLVKQYGSVYFDLIFLFGHARNHELKAISDAGEALVTIREFDCFDGRCAPYILNNGVHVFQISYMIDMHLYADLAVNRTVIHSPHCADPAIFYKPATLDQPERQGGELAGAVTIMYPLRTRWEHLIKAGRLPGAHIYAHPGYFQDSYTAFMEKNGGRAWNEEDAAKVEQREQQIRTFAESLKRVKILLMDSSAYRYAFAKFIEGVMAGCLILSDIPNDRPELYRQLTVEVDPTASDDELVAVYNYWMTHDEERVARVRAAQRLVFPEFTYDTSIDRLIDGVNLYRRHQYGLFYSGSFVLSCAATNMLKGESRNRWCPAPS